MSRQETIIIFGEVLFDHFPDDSQVLGGAPFNVAWNLQAFGVQPLLISRIGEDALGKQIIDSMNDWGLNIEGVQIDAEYPTGTVEVRIENNNPSFEIVSDVAYDYIDYPHLPSLPQSAMLYHGSLALRNKVSKITLERILSQIECRVFMDVNLRTPWWNKSLIDTFSHCASWLKLNQEELEMLTSGDSLQQRTVEIFSTTDIKELIFTQGEQGAMIMTRAGEPKKMTPQKNASFVDAVGAGDAFSSIFLLGKYLSWPIDITLQRAQEFASGVVGLRGATTTDKLFYQAYGDRWMV